MELQTNKTFLSPSTGNLFRIVEFTDDAHVRVERINAPESKRPETHVWVTDMFTSVPNAWQEVCTPSVHTACTHKPELINFDERLVPSCNGGWIDLSGAHQQPQWFDYLSRLPKLEYEVHGVRLDGDNDNYSEAPLGEAERFGLYRVVYVGGVRELRHLKDFISAEYAFRAKMRRESLVEEGEVFCAIHEHLCPSPTRELVLLSCSGGATGDLYLCPVQYREHVRSGGEDGTCCGICC